MAKERKKRVNPYSILDREKNPDEYALLDSLVGAHHPHLADAKIGLAWRQGFKEDADGRIILGQCRKASALQQRLHGYDFVIVLNLEFWSSPRTTERQRQALMDHELCHASVSIDKDGEEKTDAHGRPIWRTRKHDLEEFREIVTRHGLYKSDLQAFAEAIRNAKQAPLLEGAAPERAEVRLPDGQVLDLHAFLRSAATAGLLLDRAKEAKQVYGKNYEAMVFPLRDAILDRVADYQETEISAALQLNGAYLAEQGKNMDAVLLAAAVFEALENPKPETRDPKPAQPDRRKSVVEFAGRNKAKTSKPRASAKAAG